MKGIRVALAAVGIAILTASGVAAQGRGLGNINGTITADDGNPVAGAVIKVHLTGGDALEGKSDGSGKWNITGIGKGEFQVEFAKEGFVTRRVKLVVEKEAMRTDPIKIELKRG